MVWATTPLKPTAGARTFRMVDDEHDVEVFERIPWDSLPTGQDRRWLAYLVSAVVVVAAVGVSIGRSTASPPVTTPTTVSPSTAVTPIVAAPPETVSVATTPAATWSEADLMALPAPTLEVSAAALAEWFVVDHFTRGDGDAGRSFVEWAETWEVEWSGATSVDVTVLMRRLAALGDDPYQRIPAEAWLVTAELTDEGWGVVAGPRPTPVPEVSMSSLETGPTRTWTDGAGLEWDVGSETSPAP